MFGWVINTTLRTVHSTHLSTPLLPLRRNTYTMGSSKLSHASFYLGKIYQNKSRLVICPLLNLSAKMTNSIFYKMTSGKNQDVP